MRLWLEAIAAKQFVRGGLQTSLSIPRPIGLGNNYGSKQTRLYVDEGLSRPPMYFYYRSTSSDAVP